MTELMPVNCEHSVRVLYWKGKYYLFWFPDGCQVSTAAAVSNNDEQESIHMINTVLGQCHVVTSTKAPVTQTQNPSPEYRTLRILDLLQPTDVDFLKLGLTAVQILASRALQCFEKCKKEKAR
jgi:hypothetical protein